MKQVFFNPALVGTVNAKPGFLPQIRSRRMFGSSGRGSSCYRTEGEEAAAQAQLLQKVTDKINEGLQTRVAKTDLPEGFSKLTATQLTALVALPAEQLRSIADEKTGVLAMLTAQGTKIAELETRISKNNEPQDLSIRGQIKTWLESKVPGTDETIQQRVAKIKAGEKKDLPMLQLRAAASPMTVATVNSGTSPYIGRTTIESGINDILSNPFVFWNTLTKGRTNSPTYGWINKTNRQGAAGFIAPGVAKPAISFSLVAETSVAKKVADSAKTTTELLDDIDGMATFIEEELKYAVFSKVNSTLMDSAGSSTVPTGIKQLSVAFDVDGAVTTTNPNYMDAIRAVVAQIKATVGLTGEVTVFINPLDAANMDMAKATDSGVYMLPPFVTADGRKIGGASIIEDNNVPVGTIQAGILRYYRILIYKDFTVSWGWENDDFTKNLVSAVGEMRLHQFFNEIYTGAFVRDTFANIIDALTPAA